MPAGKEQFSNNTTFLRTRNRLRKYILQLICGYALTHNISPNTFVAESIKEALALD